MHTFINRHVSKGKLISSALLFVIFLSYAIIKNITEYHYDAIYYWTIADGLFSQKTINLYNFPETFRGCCWPLLCQLIKLGGASIFGSEIWGYRVFSSFLYAVTLGYFLPEILNYKVTTIWKVIQLCLIIIPILFFWGDLLQYPLSDAVSLCFIIAGVFFAKKSFESGNKIMLMICGLLGGAFLYFGYNTRVIFLYGILCGIILLVVIYGIKKHENKRSRFCQVALLTVVGIIICAIPQIIINYHYMGILSPKVYTEQLFSGQQNLQMAQVYWGLTRVRDEGYIGDPNQFPLQAISYPDRTGIALLDSEGITLYNCSIVSWINLVVKHPLDCIGIYFKHLISLMTNLYPEVYIHHLYESKAVRTVLSILLWMVGGLGIVSCLFQKKNHNIKYGQVAFCICLIIPSLLQLAGAPEIRFFLPVHLLLYCYICWKIDYHSLFVYVKLHAIPVLFVSVTIIMLWITIISNILSTAPYRMQLINDIPIEEQIVSNE